MVPERALALRGYCVVHKKNVLAYRFVGDLPWAIRGADCCQSIWILVPWQDTSSVIRGARKSTSRILLPWRGFDEDTSLNVLAVCFAGYLPWAIREQSVVLASKGTSTSRTLRFRERFTEWGIVCPVASVVACSRTYWPIVSLKIKGIKEGMASFVLLGST